MPHNVGDTSPTMHLPFLLAADEWFPCLPEYPTALCGSDLLTPLSPSPFPWLAVLLLYITLPKCNLLKHALTQLKSKNGPIFPIDLSFLTYIQIARPVPC